MKGFKPDRRFFSDERHHCHLISWSSSGLEMSEPLGLNLQPGVCREQLGQIAMGVGELHDQTATLV